MGAAETATRQNQKEESKVKPENAVTRVTGEMLSSQTAATARSEAMHPETITHADIKQRNAELWDKNWQAPDATRKE